MSTLKPPPGMLEFKLPQPLYNYSHSLLFQSASLNNKKSEAPWLPEH
ncbi:hypothetical protein LINPERPRIM_LOCUS17215 [Linum perenne]